MALRSFALQAASIAALCASPAAANEVKDVLLLPDGALFIALEQTPADLTARSEPGRLSVDIPGWSAAPRAIAPYGPAGFSMLRVTPDGFVMEGAPDAATVSVAEGGVLIRPGASGVVAPAPAAGETTPAPRRFSAEERRSEPAGGAGAAPAEAPPAEPAARAAAASTPSSADPSHAADRAAPEASQDVSGDTAPPAAAQTQPAAAPCAAQAAALADAPWDLDRIVAQADCLAEAGAPQNAAGLYEQVLAFQPEHFRAALGLARIRQQSGRHEDAARLFETAAGSALTDGDALAAQAAARRAREQGER